MLIGLSILFFTSFGFLLSSKNQKKYYLAIAIAFALLFALYNPPITDDLYRYYNMFDIIKDKSISDCIHLNFDISDWYLDYAIKDMMQNTRVFMLIMLILSRTGIKQLLPIFCCLCTYIPLICLVDKIGKKGEYNNIATNIGYVIIFCTVDYRFISCLRNLMAYAIFCLILYLDFHEDNKIKRAIYFFIYFILCELHMSCAVLLVLRITVLIFNDRFKMLISSALLLLNVAINIIIGLMETYLSFIPYVARLAKRASDYYLGRTNYNFNGAIFFVTCIFAVIFVILFGESRNKDNEEQAINAGGGLQKTYAMYIICFTLGSITQYDVLVRNTSLISMLSIPFIMLFYNNCVRREGTRTHLKTAKNRVLVFTASMILVYGSLLFYTLFSYMPMQNGF